MLLTMPHYGRRKKGILLAHKIAKRRKSNWFFKSKGGNDTKILINNSAFPNVDKYIYFYLKLWQPFNNTVLKGH